MADAFDDLARLAQDLDRAGALAGRQARGIVAKGVDRAAADAKARARTVWNRSGLATGASADSIRARMSRTSGGDLQAGYLFVEGGGAYQETGTGHHPPNPVIEPAVVQQTDYVADLLANLDVL
jgi:HK97 gp10 family phage protein